jgi:hypothetical protein
MRPVFNYAGHYDATGTFIPVDLQTFDGLWWLVSGKSFGSSMFAYDEFELEEQIRLFVEQVWRTFFVVGFGPGLLGFWIVLRCDWRLGLMLWLMFLGHTIFYINYSVIDKDTMFLPSYLIWALWLGVGYQWLFDLINNQNEPTTMLQRSHWLLHRTIIMVVFIALVWNWSIVSRAHDWSTREYGEEMLNNLEPNALIFGWWDIVPIVQYLQLVEGRRPDIKAINRFLITPQNMWYLIEREINQHPVYINDVPTDLPDNIQTEPVGSFYQLKLVVEN